MTEARADEAQDGSDDPITALVEAAVQAHAEGGEAALESYCRGLGAERDVVLHRLSRLRRIGLLGDPTPAPTPVVPERLGDFELQEPLGRGGMGVVYRARQVSLDREVALKVIRPEQLFFPGVRERFRREVEIIARLQHEGIVRLYSFGEERGIPWFAMERIRGCSLAAVIEHGLSRAGQPLTGADFAACLREPIDDGPGAQLFAGSWSDVALAVMERAALALEDAHRQGVLHRDIKPSNIMLTASGRVVLLDFGLAWSRDADHLTRSGAELGTIHYMAPEQFQAGGNAVDERTDVYALGVVLRELLTLRPAFAGTTIDQVAHQVREGLPTPFVQRDSTGTRELETICLVAMDRDQARRYASPRLFARDLRNHLEHRPIAAVRPTLALRLRRLAQRHRAATTATLALAVAALAAPFGIAWRERALRRDLEQTNAALTTQIERADRNLTLAADALSDTLTRFDEEHISQIPDLRGFVDGVLVNSSAFLDALLVSNPAAPEARLRLAEVLVKVASVRWQFFDLPRTEPLFARVLELVDGTAGDPDRVDQIDLETRLALVYVRRLFGDPPAAVAAYQTALDRIRPHGDFTTRPLALRHQIGRCIERLALVLRHREGPQLDLLTQAQRLFLQNAREESTVTAWLEVARIELELAEMTMAASGREAARPHELAHAEALVAAEAAEATAKPEEREQLAAAFSARGSRLQAERQLTEALAALRIAETQYERLIVERPSRLDNLVGWIAARTREAGCLELMGRTDEQRAMHQSCAERVAAALAMWPTQTSLLRDYLFANRRIVELALAAPVLDESAKAALDAANTWAERGAKLPSAVLVEQCSYIAGLRARIALRDGDLDQAMADVATADQLTARAVELAKVDRVTLWLEPTHQMVAAEVLLRRGQNDDALARLNRVRQLPDNLLERVPALLSHRDNPAFAPTFARIGKR